MGKPIRSVTVVGGGTAGWLTAALLNRMFPSAKEGEGLSVTLIESPNVPIIGVGEATVPNMRRTLQMLGIPESVFFQRTDAAFKMGARFVNWDHSPSGDPVEFVNVISSPPFIDGRQIGEYFLAFHPKRYAPEAGVSYSDLFTPTFSVMNRGQGPRPIGTKDFDTMMGYSYHFDAGKFAGLLSELAKLKGVHHIRDDVDEVRLDEKGNVASLELRERGSLPIEFVIDCTGFRGLIIQQALEEPFESYDKYILNDRAAVMQIKHLNPEKIEASTRATGLSAGWSFRVPLSTRIGTGYVFSSRHISDEEAIDELLGFYGDQAKGANPRVIPMKIGRLRNSWVKNCLALGLAGGFIEPLEATAIYMTDMSVRWLTHYWPSLDFEPGLVEAYNRKVNVLFDEVRDFIQAHYYLSNRTDTEYWITAREELPISDRLQHLFEVWSHALPDKVDLPGAQLFDFDVYTLLLIAKGFYRDKSFDNSRFLNQKAWQAHLQRAKQMSQMAQTQLPGHVDLLRSMGGGTVSRKPQPQRLPGLGGPLQAS